MTFGSAEAKESANFTSASMAIVGSCALMVSMKSGSAEIRAFAMPLTASMTWGIISFKLEARPEIPSLIFAMPDESPVNRAVKPSIDVVRDGKNSAIRLFFAPDSAVFISCKLSWNAAPFLTASSDITPPKSWTACRIASVSSALVLRSAPSSMLCLPRSF